MPEAPEVQRVVKTIAPLLVGSTIDRHRSLHHRFSDLDYRMRVRSVHRHGKWIVVSDGDRVLLLHLGMSGRFVIGGPVEKHARWIAVLDRDGERTLLQFVDPRCFGRFRVLSTEESRMIMRPNARSTGVPELGLGPDVMSEVLARDEPRRVVARWRTMLRAHIELKRALLSQHLVAGLGNIYASEACWYARASPFRMADSLTSRQLSLLAKSVPPMLSRALRLGGTSIGDANSYRGVDGTEGRAVTLLRVYGRAGESCKRCRHTIQRTRQRGRTTYYCANCQE